MWMGACQAAESLLNALGQSSVELLLPVERTADEHTGMGMSASGWRVTLLEPVLIRWNDEETAEILVGAQTLAQQLEPTTLYGVRDLANRARCRVGNHTLRVKFITAEWCENSEYLYRFVAEV